MGGVKAVTGAAVAVLMLALAGTTPALADTIEAALVRAYQNNPQLNSQRASVRSTDENVPQALSGYRPKVAITASAGYQYTDAQSSAGGSISSLNGTQVPRSVGATITQTLYNGQQTANRTRAAEGQVSAAREGLRVLEQTVLLAAATIYMQLLVRGQIAALPLKGVIDLSAEKARLDKEMAKAEADIKRVDAKLANEKFVANAPEEIVEEEKEKRAEAVARKAKILEALERLRSAA